ncbi:MAG TPA: MFS transporter, partial [Vicinamibacterales bacterium]
MAVQAAEAASPADVHDAFMKAAWRLVPFVTIGYLLNYMDRNNVGFAALTMNRDTGLTATQFGFGAGVLFFGYSFFEIPSNMALYRFGARRWIARIMITWGLVSAATAFVRGPQSWYALRFLLGVAEAGFFPGITFYLATWFPAEYRARMLAWFLVAIPASTVVGGPISGLILQMNGVLGLAGWQWLFILEGLPATLMGIAALRVLPDRPEDATFLTPEERRLVREKIASERRERETRHLLAALKDPRVLILTVAQFGFTAGSYGVGIWLPQIMKDAHLSNVTIGFLTGACYVVASIAMIAWAAWVDRTGHKIRNLTLA